MVSHDVPQVFEVSDKIAYMNEGKIELAGSVSEVMPSDNQHFKRFLAGKRWTKTSYFPPPPQPSPEDRARPAQSRNSATHILSGSNLRRALCVWLHRQ